MKPLGSRVLIKRLPITEQIGSIIIPTKYRTLPQEGSVEATGPTVSTVQVGDRVLFGRYNTIGVPGSPDLLLIWERDLMCVLDG